MLSTWGLKDKWAEDCAVHVRYTFTRLKSLVRMLHNRAVVKRGLPLRGRIKKKKKKRKSAWNTRKYMHTKNQASGYLLLALLQNQRLYSEPVPSRSFYGETLSPW